jgi:DNA-binding transcriptional MerR regulator/methylmalonyl-CoA mutase cobalamin-binding subunit
MAAADRDYGIRDVARLTGLAPARLRAWERRYEVVRPARQANRYRRYTARQVALLRAFARLCAAGERIGDLVREPREAVLARAEGNATDHGPLSRLLEAVKRLDREGLTRLLAEERRAVPEGAFGSRIILPLAELIGDQWALGRLSVAAEHLASEVVVQELKRELGPGNGPSPLLLGACLEGEQHEWGFLVTLAALRRAGWRVRYLGQSLPLRDLVDAAWTTKPDLVLLSAADPANVSRHLAELRRLPRLLPPGTRLVLGGAGPTATAARLRRAGLEVGREAIPELRPTVVRNG